MLGLSYGELLLLLGATAALIGPKDLPIIARTAGRLARRAIGYVQVARGQLDSVMQQSQARQVHKELQDTIAQLDAIHYEIRSMSVLNPGPMTRRMVDNLDNTSSTAGMSNLQAAYAAAFKQERPSIPEDISLGVAVRLVVWCPTFGTFLVPPLPYGIRFLPNATESSGMSSLNTSTYSYANTSLGCSCGDCPSTSICSDTAPPSTHKSGSCTIKIRSLKGGIIQTAKCIDFAMVILYIILISTFFGRVLFYKSLKRNQAYRMKAFVNAMDGGEPQSVNRQKDENLQTDMFQGTQTRNMVQLSIVQGYLSNFYRGYGTWVARNPTIVLIVSLVVVLLLCIGLIRFKVETRPEKVGVQSGTDIVLSSSPDGVLLATRQSLLKSKKVSVRYRHSVEILSTIVM